MAKLSIFVGSVYGNAQHVAEEVKKHVDASNHQADIVDDPTVDDFKSAEFPLFITSTTGQGDLPPNIEFFVMDLRDAFPLMGQKPFAVAALGDSSYGDTYCGAGKQVFELLEELQGKAASPLLEVDAIETLEPEKDVVDWVSGILNTL
jgi:flavodoxin